MGERRNRTVYMQYENNHCYSTVELYSPCTEYYRSARLWNYNFAVLFPCWV